MCLYKVRLCARLPERQTLSLPRCRWHTTHETQQDRLQAIRCVGERQFSCRWTAAHEPTHTLTARLPARCLARVYQTEFQSEKIVRIDKTRWISRIGPSICVLFHFILFCFVFLFIVFSLFAVLFLGRCHRRTYEWIGVRVCVRIWFPIHSSVESENEHRTNKIDEYNKNYPRRSEEAANKIVAQKLTGITVSRAAPWKRRSSTQKRIK